MGPIVILVGSLRLTMEFVPGQRREGKELSWQDWLALVMQLLPIILAFLGGGQAAAGEGEHKPEVKPEVKK